MKSLTFKWLPRLGLWDCTDGEIHGGGKTQEEARTDYERSLAEEIFDQTVGWGS